MKLVEIAVENFRGIRGITLPLDNLTVLIGENNSGKSSVLEALKLALTRGLGSRRGGQFSEYDFHLPNSTATPHGAPPVKIILHFAEATMDEWSDSINQQLNEVIQPDMTTGLGHIWFLIEGTFNTTTETFETRWAFLNSHKAELVLKSSSPISLLQRFVPLFYLSALRDASQEFGDRGQFWKSFLKTIQIPEADRKPLELTLHEINKTVIAASPGLTQVTQQIANAKKLVPLDVTDPVILEALPTRILDMVGKIQVHLRSPLGAKLPLHKHGEGTQGLAVLLLFQAFTEANLAEVYDPDSTAILALEEPEAHLHPSAIRSLGQFLNQLTGQILVTSHSGDLVSRVPILSLRRLYTKNGETKIGMVQPGLLTPRETQAIDYNIRLTRGAYLFSRCWLLVEGESDFHILPLVAEALGYSQDAVSFSVLEISQVIDKGEPFIKFAKALGIQWFMLADGDAAGRDYTNRAQQYLEPGEAPVDRAYNLAAVDLEHEFWYGGFETFITNLVSTPTQAAIRTAAAGNAPNEVKSLIKAAIKAAGGKPAFAQELFSEVKRRGSASVPPSIRGVLARVAQLAGG